jgi:SAM-dependent methyltransferase
MNTMIENEIRKNRYRPQIETFTSILQKHHNLDPSEKILDFGCGNGIETGYLHLLTGAQAYGIDVKQTFDLQALSMARLSNYDGYRIPFADGFFDLVYSFHVLEHVGDLHNSLSEVRRVLKSGGMAYFGVPNKERIIGYIGMPEKSFFEKIRQNCVDWKLRLGHRFENTLGAHAGFRESELLSLMTDFFSTVLSVTDQYYHFKHHRLRQVSSLIMRTGLNQFVWPSVYVLCTK